MDQKRLADAVESFGNQTFYPSDILVECPKFRILVAGQTGSGKSTLCSKVFNVSAEHGEFGISHHSRGTLIHQVWNEITFPGQNEEIILHDSGGFEAGDTAGLDEIRKFIKSRLKSTTLAEQLHCIWYCIPLTGHRHIQSAEKIFFNDFDLGDIPVVAVFTHFDEVENKYEFELMKKHQREHPTTLIPKDLRDRANAFAVRDYDEIHRRNLEAIIRPQMKVAIHRVSMPQEINAAGTQGVNKLISQTMDMLTKEGLRRLWVSAQQQSAELKRNGIVSFIEICSHCVSVLSRSPSESIQISMRRFERVTISSSIPLVPFLSGSIFSSAFRDIYSDVTRLYGLIDPSRILQSKTSRKRIFEACLKLSATERLLYQTGLKLNITGPLAAASVTASLLKMIAGTILIHEELFWKQRDENGLLLTSEAVQETCARFSESKRRAKVAAHIDGTVMIQNYTKKEYCQDVLTTALKG
ncbi:MAG: hypothetical protein Q9190_000406 [Brigantiaea leucoxantha]